MMRTLDASRWQTFRRVETPTALPYTFSGAKIAVAVAVIGAVFAEWHRLGGPGLGHLIVQDGDQTRNGQAVRGGAGPLGDGDGPLRPAGPRGAARRHLAIEHRE